MVNQTISTLINTEQMNQFCIQSYKLSMELCCKFFEIIEYSWENVESVNEPFKYLMKAVTQIYEDLDH